MRSSYTSRPFVLAAVVYVDNTDLLHWPPLAYTSPEDLIKFIRKEITDWGLLSPISSIRRYTQAVKMLGVLPGLQVCWQPS
jgi:hypothetical protein